MRSHSIVLLILGSLVTLLGCEREVESQADVETAPTGLVRLSSEAQESIGLETVQVTHQSFAETITTAGWLMVKPGIVSVVGSQETDFTLAPRFGMISVTRCAYSLLIP